MRVAPHLLVRRTQRACTQFAKKNPDLKIYIKIAIFNKETRHKSLSLAFFNILLFIRVRLKHRLLGSKTIKQTQKIVSVRAGNCTFYLVRYVDDKNVVLLLNGTQYAMPK